MAVFVALLVFHGVDNPPPTAVQKTLCTFLLNDMLKFDYVDSSIILFTIDVLITYTDDQ